MCLADSVMAVVGGSEMECWRRTASFFLDVSFSFWVASGGRYLSTIQTIQGMDDDDWCLIDATRRLFA